MAKSKNSPINETTQLEGWVSIRSALISKSRKVYTLLLRSDKRNSHLQSLKKRAREQNIAIEYLSKAELAEQSQGKSHGGAIALVGPRRYVPLASLGKGSQASFIAMLDGVEDPYNYGQALRSLFAAGVHGLIVRPRNWLSAAAVVARASAGASELIPTACIHSDAELDQLKTRDIAIVCTSLDPESHSLYKANLKQNLLLVIGGEKRGIPASILAKADVKLHIPYGRNFKQALDTTSATAAIAFEIMRQRKSL